MKTEYKHIYFEEYETETKTKAFFVKNNAAYADLLGYVKWYAPWRKYCFFIYMPGLVMDASCLADIFDGKSPGAVLYVCHECEGAIWLDSLPVRKKEKTE